MSSTRKESSSFKKFVSTAGVVLLSCAGMGGGVLWMDNALDGQNDILQGIGLEDKYGSTDHLVQPTEAGTDSSNTKVDPSATAIPSAIPADEHGLPADGSKVDTSGISPGGGLPMEGHDWDTMAPMELSIPEVNLVIPIVEKGVIPTGSGTSVSMDLPVSYQAGWLNTSASLNATKGTTFIAGHVNWLGGGLAPMSGIKLAKPGMIVRTSDAEGHIQKWVVDEHDPSISQPVKWADLTKNYDIENKNGERKLILTTCEDSTDDGIVNYDSNYVVTASPLN